MSYGSGDKSLTFAEFIVAMRAFFEDSITDWLKLNVGDEERLFTIDDYF